MKTKSSAVLQQAPTPYFSLAGRTPVQAVVIGASAGGVQALLAILLDLPASFKLPIVVVIHLPADRESQLSELFASRLRLPVNEAQDKETIAAGTVYFAGPGYHLSIESDRTFSLSGEPPLHYSRPSIDMLMESAADAYGPGLAGILLTGANSDGACGMAAIRRQNGLTVVQDPAQAEAPAMPNAAIRNMQPDFILRLDHIHSLLLQLDGKPP